MRIARKIKREQTIQARKAYRLALKEEGFRQTQSQLQQQSYKLGFQRGVIAAIEHQKSNTNTKIILSPKQTADMLYEVR